MPTLLKSNIEAARQLRQRSELKSWDDADRSLQLLAGHFPDNIDLAQVLAKASAIDKLYSTRAGNIYWVAGAVVSVMKSLGQGKLKAKSGIDIVDAICTAKTEAHEGSDRCTSFASKYCYFFVRGWEFPLYDSYAVSALKRVYGRVAPGQLTKGRSEYRDFCERLALLRDRDSLRGVSVRDMDRFLWLWGQWIAQRGSHTPIVNAALYSLFRARNPKVESLLKALSPE